MTDQDDFAERIARVRERFVSTLNDKIAACFAALPELSDGVASAVDTTAAVFRRLHEMQGIAPTLGFPLIGDAARCACDVVREAAKEKRVPTADEVDTFKAALERLRAVAGTDLGKYEKWGTANA